jgi:pimeloyl-ACP methyl ester carboxylesterase
VSVEGGQRIRQFVLAMPEFVSLDDYVEYASRFARARSPERLKQGAQYNFMRTTDGTYASKHDMRPQVDGRDAPSTLVPPRSSWNLMMCPILLVRGGRSQVLPEESAREFVSDIPNGELVTVPGAGHNVHSDNVRGFLEAILPFLE